MRKRARISPPETTAIDLAEAEKRTEQLLSIGDPALAEYLSIGSQSTAGVVVTESSALGLASVWRCVNLIAGTIGTLPIKTYEDDGGRRKRVESFLDEPAPDMTQFGWSETVVAQQCLWGNDYLLHQYGGASQILGVAPVPPAVVSMRIDPDLGKVFKVTQADGSVIEYTGIDITHIPGFSVDGIRGLSPIGVARNSMGAMLAGDKAAASMFKNGLLLGGILSSKQTLNKTQSKKVTDGLQAKTGASHAGDVAFLPADISFTPWTMNPVDAQFLESRHFGVEEIARWFGVPRELLSESGASSWGTGIQELVRGFARFTLTTYTSRIEQKLSKLLPPRRFCEYDYSGLLQGSPQEEITLLIEQVRAGILTVNEARAIRNMEPLPVAPITPTEVTEPV